jgi:hypothetical protein
VRLRRSSIVLALVGLLLLVAAALTRFVILPAGTRLPGSTDITVRYTGSGTLLNAKALAAGDTAHALATGVPVGVDRRTYVKSVHGGTAIVGDDVTLTAGGTTQTDRHTYALDRTRLTGVASPDTTAVEPTAGALAVAWPIGPSSSKPYQLYDIATRRSWPAKYLGTGSTDGRSTYRFSYSASAPLRDPVVAASLPAALPKSILASLAPLLPAATAAQLTGALPALPADVPISYQAATTLVAVVDQQTGLIVDTTQDQQIIAGVTLGGATASLLPVMAVKVKLTPASVTMLAGKAKSAGRLLTLIGVVVPLALLVIGLGLVVVAVLRRTAPKPASPDSSSGEPAGAPGRAEPVPAAAESGSRTNDPAI